MSFFRYLQGASCEFTQASQSGFGPVAIEREAARLVVEIFIRDARRESLPKWSNKASIAC